MKMKMPNFRTVYDRVRVESNSGDIYEPTYKLKADENGVRDLKVTGKVNCYDMIQSHADSVDLKLILQKFANGDTSALNKVNGCYGDFTDMPTTYAELSQRVLEAENLFDSLPLETRELFNHDPSQFFASIGTEKFNKAIGLNSDPVDVAPEISIQSDVSTDVKEGDTNE